MLLNTYKHHHTETVFIFTIFVSMSRAVSREFLGTPFFEMVIFPYRHHGCLGVRQLRVFNSSNLLKTYSVESNTLTLVPYKTHQQNLNNFQKNYLKYVKTGRNDRKFTIGKYHINAMSVTKLFRVNIFISSKYLYFE